MNDPYLLVYTFPSGRKEFTWRLDQSSFNFFLGLDGQFCGPDSFVPGDSIRAVEIDVKCRATGRWSVWEAWADPACDVLAFRLVCSKLSPSDAADRAWQQEMEACKP